MWSQNCIIEPGRFIQHVQKVAKEKNMSIFTDFSQKDVSEFLLFIIDCFHNDIARPVKMQIHGDAVTETDTLAIKVFDMIRNSYSKEYSEVWNIFYGTHVSEIVSKNDTSVILSQTPEPFFTLSVPIPNKTIYPTLYDCIDEHVKEISLREKTGGLTKKLIKSKTLLNELLIEDFLTYYVLI